MGAIGTRILEGFDDPTFPPEAWEDLVRRTNMDSVYLTWHWQRAWWETYGRGDLLLIAAERDGRIVALAPLYARSGMIYFVGAAHWQADNLDFIGDVSDPEVLGAILETACRRAPGFLGFQLEFVRDSSSTGKLLGPAGERIGLSCYDEWDEIASAINLSAFDESKLAAAYGKSVLKRERFFRRTGSFKVQHLRDGKSIFPHLEDLFEQHVARWFETPHQSFFQDQRHRGFYERLTRIASDTGWLRFTRIDWGGRGIAFHYGFCYGGRYFWNVSSFAVDLARRSPGQVLLRQLLVSAIDEGTRYFDFGAGRQPFKLRLASETTRMRAWGLYPSPRLSQIGQTSTSFNPPLLAAEIGKR